MALEHDHSSTDETSAKKQEVANKYTDEGDIEATGERRDFGHNKNVGGRIAPVLPHLSGYDFGNESGEDILGKQIELEANNEIQYRTCSWQKVYYRSGGWCAEEEFLLIWMSDCSITLFRVHLFGYHVLSILIFGFGSCTRTHFNCSRRGSGSLHFLNRLVRIYYLSE